MDNSEFEANALNWRDLDDFDAWIDTFKHETAENKISDQVLSHEIQHKDNAMFLDYGSFINYDDVYNFDWTDDNHWVHETGPNQEQ